MKTMRYVPLSVVALSCIFLAGCLVWESDPKVQNIDTVTYGSVEIKPIRVDRNPDTLPGWGYDSFDLTIRNDTDDNISIVWQETLYVRFGMTNGWFCFAGDEEEANSPKPSDIIFKKSTFTRRIYPVHWLQHDKKRAKWTHDIMPEGENGVYLVVISNGLPIKTRIVFNLAKVKYVKGQN